MFLFAPPRKENLANNMKWETFLSNSSKIHRSKCAIGDQRKHQIMTREVDVERFEKYC